MYSRKFYKNRVSIYIRFGFCSADCRRLCTPDDDASLVTRHVTQCTAQHHTSHVTRHKSHKSCKSNKVTHQHVTRHTSPVKCCTSHVTRHTSYFTRHTTYKARKSHDVTCHTSHVTRHTSHKSLKSHDVTRHTPQVVARNMSKTFRHTACQLWVKWQVTWRRTWLTHHAYITTRRKKFVASHHLNRMHLYIYKPQVTNITWYSTSLCIGNLIYSMPK